MQLTRTHLLRLIRLSGILLLTAVIVIYAVWRSLNYARGPAIEIYEPANGAAIEDKVTVLRGKALRVTSLSLNGKEILIDQQGNWSETVIIFPGLNRLTLSAGDRFGRTKSRELDLVGKSAQP